MYSVPIYLLHNLRLFQANAAQAALHLDHSMKTREVDYASVVATTGGLIR